MNRAPKPWDLSEEANLTSFTQWKSRVLYYIKQDDKLAPFLVTEPAPFTWKKHVSGDLTRGFKDDTGDAGLKVKDKVARLEDMLGLISQYAPPLLSNDIVKNSVSLDSIWQMIRQYLNLQQDEIQFMKLYSIKRETEERPQKLYQRILSHVQDNLLSPNSPLLHDGKIHDKIEDLSPTLERWVVLHWMSLLHPELPALVQRTYAFDLQTKTLKDLQSQICKNLDAFLADLDQNESKIAKANITPFKSRKPQFNSSSRYRTQTSPRSSGPRKPTKECRICKSENRRYTGHTMAECHYISSGEKRDILRACSTSLHEDEERQYEELEDEEDHQADE